MSEDKIDVYISVGSNIEPESNIINALIKLSHYAEVVEVSTFYRTEPIERPEQPHFLNGIFHIRTDIPARELKFEVLRKIESELGRVRTDDKYAPRTIDLDIVIYGNRVIYEPDIKIPDPEIKRRLFIKLPLLELQPLLILPEIRNLVVNIDSPIGEKSIEPDLDFTEKLKSVLESIRKNYNSIGGSK